MPFTSPDDYLHLVSPESAGEAPGDAHWFVFRGDQLLVEIGPPSAAPTDDPRVKGRPSWARLPFGPGLQTLGITPTRTLYIGRLGETHLYAAEALPGAAPPEGMSWQGLRTLFSVLEDTHFALAGRAVQLVDWDRNHQFCGRCGTPTESKTEERARVCPACKLSCYPKIAPAVMALVRRGSQMLLGRGPHFPRGMFSALAGFVEPGETLEQCIAREVLEEVGIKVTNVRYFASQPWPFPNSLMIAFFCDYASGEICPQEAEIEAAEWFDVFQLPQLPSKISIARRLIDAAAETMRADIGRGA
ncbi:MAG: NAD(+) diphosphatase [Betaproteobacteria bacterium]|nr:NAD(+) diphosphatase [Betaproteobacteria bacterium]